MITSPLRLVMALVLGLVATQRAYATTANDVCAPAADPCIVQDTIAVTSGSILDFGTRALVFPGGSGKRFEAPLGGSMMIIAGSVTIEPGSAILAKAGSVDILSTGSVIVRRSGNTRARIDVSDQLSPGTITIETIGPNADVVIEGTVTAHGTGVDGGGGSVDISASVGTTGGDVAVQGDVLAGGGGQSLGGDISIAASGMVNSSGTIDVSAGDGGDVSIVGGTGVTLAASGSAKLVVQGTLAGGDSGDVDIQAIDGDLVIEQLINATGAPEIDFGGSGATITLLADQGSIELGGSIAATGGSPDGDGGEIFATAALDIVHTGPIAAQGRSSFGTGGFVELFADRAVRLGPADVQADCLDCVAGDVTVFAGCDVTVPGGVAVVATGPSGTIKLASGDTMQVAGTLTAGGSVELRHRDPATPPNTAGAVITPAPTIVVDPLLNACGCVSGPCGDGVLNCGEACDNGMPGVDDAECSADCQRVPDCGDGVVDEFLGETCDDGNQTDCDGCSRTCQIEACGNFVTECDEQCDEGPAGSDVCQPDCRFATPAGCGDDVLDEATEECDDGNTEDCDGCNRLCQIERCGNGIVECDEECDDFNTDPCDGCSPTCRLEVCGNGIVDCGEECDDGDQNGQPGSNCLAEVCEFGSICSSDSTSPCIPCGDDLDCDPSGRCGGVECVEGICELSPLDCDDENPCTTDACDPEVGCTHTLRDASEVPSCTAPDRCSVATCTVDGCVITTLLGFDGVRCHLADLDDLLADSSVDARAKRVLGKLRTKIGAQLTRAEQGVIDGKFKRVRKGLRKARGLSGKTRKRVERFFTRKRITDIDVAAALAAKIDATVEAVENQMLALGVPL